MTQHDRDFIYWSGFIVAYLAGKLENVLIRYREKRRERKEFKKNFPLTEAWIMRCKKGDYQPIPEEARDEVRKWMGNLSLKNNTHDRSSLQSSPEIDEENKSS